MACYNALVPSLFSFCGGSLRSYRPSDLVTSLSFKKYSSAVLPVYTLGQSPLYILQTTLSKCAHLASLCFHKPKIRSSSLRLTSRHFLFTSVASSFPIFPVEASHPTRYVEECCFSVPATKQKVTHLSNLKRRHSHLRTRIECGKLNCPCE